MRDIYEQVKTPFKYGVIIRGDDNQPVDCPTVFRHGGKWYMVYICMNRVGYETHLAESSDLLTWQPEGLALHPDHGILGAEAVEANVIFHGKRKMVWVPRAEGDHPFHACQETFFNADTQRRKAKEKKRMSKFPISISIFSIMVGALLFPIAGAGGESTTAGGVTLYVAPDGTDTWSGKLDGPNADRSDGPFATLERARDAVRAIEKEQPVTVLVRQGLYALKEPLLFAPEDSGREGRVVTYAAYGKERPVISGGALIEGWREQGDRWVADVPWVRETGKPFYQLFVNGVRRTRARSPNEGYFYSKRLKLTQERIPQCLGLKYNGNDIGDWKQMDDAAVVLFHNWVNSYNRIAKVDRESRWILFPRPAGAYFLGPKVRYYVEGVIEALDTPGEWHLDAVKGVVTYWPVPGEEMTKAEVIAPRVRSPIVLAVGTAETGPFVEHLVFRGLSFQHAGANLDKDYPHSIQGAHFQKGAFFATGMRNVVIEDCEFTRLGEHAVSLRESCASNVIRQCHMHDLGGGGVYLSEGGWIDDAPKKQTDAWLTARNTVESNFIHDGGILFRAGCGVFLGGSASYNRILHNEICNLSWTGVHLGWSWTGRRPAFTHHNEVAYNHIHHLGNGVLNDIGGIYTLGVSPGTVLHHNLIHDVTRFARGREGYGGWGIYLDAGSSEILVENNVVYNTQDGGFLAHCDGFPYGNKVINNVFAYAENHVMGRSNVQENEKEHLRIERNIIYNRGPKLYGGDNWRDKSNFSADRNCYWSETTDAPDFGNRTFQDWRKLGHDSEGVLGDPKFVDASKYDFRLKPDSPALKLGFKQIDVSTTGLTGDDAWRALPKGLTYRPVEKAPEWALDNERLVEEDFEDYDVGEKPVQALAPEGGAKVIVTDQSPAGGKRCARFEDAAGVSAWKPHWFATRKPGSGKVEVRCALRNDPAKPAQIVFELRDWDGGSQEGHKYVTGPHLKFTPEGAVQAAGGAGQAPWVDVGRYKLGEWLRVEVEFEEGEGKAKTYALRLTAADGTKTEKEALPYRSPEFTLCTWLGFMGMDEKPAIFYLDDVRME